MFTFFALAALAVPQQVKVPDAIRDRANLILAWGEQVSTPGSVAEMRERSRSVKDGSLVVTYEMYVSGVPRDLLYSISYFPINVSEPHTFLEEASIAPDGLLCPGNNLKRCGQLKFVVVSSKGEPHRFLLVSHGAKFRIAYTIIPDPIIGTDHDCKVEAIRVTPRFETALLRGSGFKANEDISITSNSAGEIVQEVRKAGAKGEFAIVLLPSVKGSNAGIDMVTFKTARCSPSIAFNWGTIN